VGHEEIRGPLITKGFIMADGTLIQQGSFVAPNADTTIQMRCDVDWMEVTNYTRTAAQDLAGVKFYWQRGMAANTGIIYYKDGMANDIVNATVCPYAAGQGGFTLVDTSINILSEGTAITAISADATPVVTSAGHGLVTGDIVRIYHVVGAQQLGGFDIRVTRVDDNNFALTAMEQIAAVVAPGANALVRKVGNESTWVPKQRVITSIINIGGANGITVVVTAVPHGLTVGQQIRLVVPEIRNSTAYGMTELNNVTTYVSGLTVQPYAFQIPINVFNYTAFNFPLNAATNMQLAQVIPVGEDTAAALTANADILGDATNNTAYIGIKLASGELSPGGYPGDVMYWTAGKSFNT
jgi:hypothetical protein